MKLYKREVCTGLSLLLLAEECASVDPRSRYGSLLIVSLKETFERAAHKLLIHDLSLCRAMFKGTLVLPFRFYDLLSPLEKIFSSEVEVEYNSREGVVRTGRHVARLSREIQSIHEEALREAKERE